MKIIKFFAFYLLNSFFNKIPFYYIRYIVYKYIYNIDIENSTSILRNVKFLDPRNIKIGKNSIVNWGCLLDGRGASVIVGENVDIAPEVNVWTLQHNPDDSEHNVIAKQVIIHDYSWIGNRVIILPGVEIAEGTVIAAGAVVTKSTEPYCLYAGVPAKKIRKLKLEKKNMQLNYKPWFM